MKIIDNDTLKVDDIVYVQENPFFGFSRFRYKKYKTKKVKRITLKRTKIILDDDREYKGNCVFYELDEELQYKNNIAEKMEYIVSMIFKLEDRRRKGTLYNLSDELIEKFYDVLKIIEREEMR